LAWRRDEPGAIRDPFLELLRKNRAAIARLMDSGGRRPNPIT
jgi:hypothetical protein